VEWLHGILKAHPEVAFFLVLGLGYLLGMIALGSFKLGAVTGTLLAGVAVGQLGVTVPGEVKQCFFLLFLFSIGFRTGPQFFRGLRSDGLAHAALAAIVAVTGLGVAYGASRLFHYDPGTSAGVVAGSLTESATIGTAMDAIARLHADEAARTAWSNNVPVAFAVTYLIGVVGAAWVLSQLAPRLMRVNLVDECRKLEKEMHGGDRESTARREFELRAYAVDPGSRWVGRKVAELEASADGARIFIERVRRHGDLAAAADIATLAAGDVVAVAGRRGVLVDVLGREGAGLREVDDRALLDLPAEMVDIVVTSASLEGRTLDALGRDDSSRGLFLRKMTRAGLPLTALPDTTIQRGDVLTVVGSEEKIARAVERIGVADRPSDVTNMFVVATAIFAGALIGLPAIRVGSVEIGLSLPVGVLLGGLVCGWLRSVRPRMFGQIPGATLWVFESIGLAGFVAVVGLNAGPDFVAGLRASGVSLIAAGALTIVITCLVGVAVGRFIFKLHPGVLLGVCAGGCTATPALAAIQEAAESAVPSIGYGVAYAVGNVLIAIWGTVIVAMVA
jgi:putative transport protein